MNSYQNTLVASILLILSPFVLSGQSTTVSEVTGYVATSSYAKKNTTTANYEVSLSGITKVAFGLDKASISVEAYSGDKLMIEANGIQPTPERAKGLKPVFNSAEDNTTVGLFMQKEGSQMRFLSTHSRDKITYKVKIPKNVNLSIEMLTWESGDISVSGLEAELEVQSKSGNVKASGSFSSLVLHNSSGNIEVVCDKMLSKPSSIAATSGFIDLTLPASAKATIKSKTYSGELYSNFDIKFVEEKEDEKKSAKSVTVTEGYKKIEGWGGTVIIEGWGSSSSAYNNKRNKVGKLNGGGVEIYLKATSNDIYLRKK